MQEIKRICLWSGPRNISTALMYSFAQRMDTKVFDEPLYAHYLRNHPSAKTYHPSANEIIGSMESDGEKVVKMMLSCNEKPVLFFKHMTHHLLGLNKDFMKKTLNVILTRDPKDMLPSFDKVISNPTLDDVGYALHLDLIHYFKQFQIPFTVLDARKVLKSTRKCLIALCEFAGTTFHENMLSWEPQQRKEDGIWAKHWYARVHKSSGFETYRPKEEPFPEHLKELLKTCQPFYESLIEYAL